MFKKLILNNFYSIYTCFLVALFDQFVFFSGNYFLSCWQWHVYRYTNFFSLHCAGTSSRSGSFATLFFKVFFSRNRRLNCIVLFGPRAVIFEWPWISQMKLEIIFTLYVKYISINYTKTNYMKYSVTFYISVKINVKPYPNTHWSIHTFFIQNHQQLSR